MVKIKKEKFYTTKDISDMLVVTEWTVREWLKNDDHPLNGIKTGQQWRVSETNLKIFLEAKHG